MITQQGNSCSVGQALPSGIAYRKWHTSLYFAQILIVKTKKLTFLWENSREIYQVTLFCLSNVQTHQYFLLKNNQDLRCDKQTNKNFTRSSFCLLNFCDFMSIMSESHFSRQILMKFTGQLPLGQNGIPLFFFF